MKPRTERQRLRANWLWHRNTLALMRDTETINTTKGAPMKLIPDDPISGAELEQAQRLAEGLQRTAQSTIVGTMPLTDTPDPGRVVKPANIGLPESVVPTETDELAQLKQQTREAEVAAKVERARVDGFLQGQREARR